MVDPGTFSPQELDRIEDALERLDDPDWDLEDALDEDPPAVRERLLDYREILVASRDALPLEDAPPDVLARVIAQAREAAEVQALGVGDVSPDQPRSWWQRLRGTLLVPGVAVAATAVLVLIIVQPTADKADSAASPARVDAQAKLVTPDAEPVSEATPAAPALEADKREAPEEELQEIATSRRPGATPGDPTVPSASPAAGAVAEPNAPADVSDNKGAEDGQLTPRWDLIARGDRARRDGDCTRARDEYMSALDDADTRVRARAEAGIGLCDMVEGAYTKAQERYDRARDLDKDIVGFIEDERPQGSLGGSSKASKAKRSAKPTSGKKASKAPPQANAFEDNAFE